MRSGRQRTAGFGVKDDNWDPCGIAIDRERQLVVSGNADIKIFTLLGVYVRSIPVNQSKGLAFNSINEIGVVRRQRVQGNGLGGNQRFGRAGT